jgi:S-adenosyl methyltransferase
LTRASRTRHGCTTLNLGGNDNYPADRAAVRQILRDFPEVPAIAKANRAFLQRAVDFHPAGAASGGAAVYSSATAPFTPRTHEQVTAFFDGLEMAEPGLVQAPLWRPEGRRPRPRDLEKIGIYAGLGHKAPASR